MLPDRGSARSRISILLLSVLALTLGPALPAFSATFFTEDFNGAAITAQLEYPTGAFTLDGGGMRRTGTVEEYLAQSGYNREYVRTVATDYNTVDFVAEISFSLLDPGPGGTILFFGIGPGEKDVDFFNESTGSALFRIHTMEVGFNASGRLDGVPMPPDWTNPDAIWGLPGADFFRFTSNEGIQRVQLTKSGNSLIFAIDQQYNGTFVADRSYTIPDITLYPWLTSENSRIFFGNADPTNKWDDLSIRRLNAAPIPEPTTMLLLGSGVAGLAAQARRRKK